jgi:short-subunit dehydrogenase
MKNDLQPIVWITGASSGIGKSLVKRFASEKINIAASARREEIIQRNSKEIPNGSKYVKIFKMDVSDYDQVEDTYKKISKNYNIECLINNAGVTSFKSAYESSIGEIQEIIDTNLLGSIYTIKTVLNGMIADGGGAVINVISAAAKKVFLNSSAYSASKSGLLSYSNVLREEVREHNIRVINVFPGATRTPIWPNDALEQHSNRMMSPDDLADLIFELYSKKTNMVAEDVVIRPLEGDL